MVDEVDIWRAANLMIKQHGETADIAAVQRIDELADHLVLIHACGSKRVLRARLTEKQPVSQHKGGVHVEHSKHSVETRLGKFARKARGLIAIICLTAIAFAHLGLAGYLELWRL